MTASRPACRRGRPCRCGPASTPAGHRDGDLVLSRRRASTGRPIMSPSCRPTAAHVDLFAWLTLGEQRRDQLRQCRHPGGGGPAQPRGMSSEAAARRRPAAAALLAAGDDQRHPARGACSVHGPRRPAVQAATDDRRHRRRIRPRRPAEDRSSPVTAIIARQEELGDLKLYRIPGAGHGRRAQPEAGRLSRAAATCRSASSTASASTRRADRGRRRPRVILLTRNRDERGARHAAARGRRAAVRDEGERAAAARRGRLIATVRSARRSRSTSARRRACSAALAPAARQGPERLSADRHQRPVLSGPLSRPSFGVRRRRHPRSRGPARPAQRPARSGR